MSAEDKKITPAKRYNPYKKSNPVNADMALVKKTSISIAVTELAPLCTMDNYNNWAKIISKVWKKLDEPDFLTCEKLLRDSGNIGLACDSAQKTLYAMERKYGKVGAITSAVKSINNDTAKSSEALVTAQTDITRNLETALGIKLDTADKRNIASLVKTATNVRHGCINEKGGLALFTQVTGKGIAGTQRGVNLKFHEDDKFIWSINGKVDGITTDGYVVEIKNRQKALFNTVRDYEMCQIQLYLHSLNIELGYLVELLPGDAEKPTQYNIIEVPRNPAYYSTTVAPWLQHLVKYCQETLLNSQETRLAILGGDVGRKCFRDYCSAGGKSI